MFLIVQSDMASSSAQNNQWIFHIFQNIGFFSRENNANLYRERESASPAVFSSGQGKTPEPIPIPNKPEDFDDNS